MPLEKKLNSEPIRGYRLLEPLGTGGFGEVWKCEAPGGIFKAIKFVYGNLGGLNQDSARAEEELRAVQLIKSIRHPFLLSIDRVECVAGELVIVTELADHNLEELLHKYRTQGRNGIPRGELLGYLRETAEVLDLLNLKFDLQHLDIKPRNLFLVSNHVKVADFGLVNSLSGNSNAKLQLGAITPLYAAPELFLGKLSRHCDQYSLAIVFQELLTGTLPYNGKNSRHLLLAHTQGEPDLSALPAADRAIVARALAKNPEHRFPSCMDLIRALMGHADVAGAAPQPAAADSVPAQALDVTPAPTRQPLAETLSSMAGDTEKSRPRQTPTLPPDVLTDHAFLESLGNTPLFDLWKVKTPAGQTRVAYFLYGLGNLDARAKESLLRFKALHHPALVPCELVHVEPGRAILLGDPVQESLRDRFLQCQSRKLPGIRRGELVDYLRAAAEVLDYLYQQHGVQHLGLNPRCLMLDNGWLQISEFGLAQLLWLPAGQNIAQRNARYAAPELFDRKISRGSDQYSLALIYAEMLSGVHPFRGAYSLRSRGTPDLATLPPQDQEVIARALDPDPARRWPSCTDMVMALEGTPPELEQELREKPDRFASLLQAPRALTTHTHGGSEGDLHQMLADILAAAGAQVAARALEDVPILSGDGTILSYKFQAGLPLGAARTKLERFHEQCFAQRVQEDENGCLLRVVLPASFWGRWLGRQLGFDIRIALSRVNPLSATPIEVAATLTTFHCNERRSRQILEEMGAPILDNLRQTLLTSAEKRSQERIAWPHPVRVIPILRHGERDEPVECRGKDISQSGLGLYLPHELDTADVLLELPNPVHPPAIIIPATLVRARPCADGWYDVGALFRLPAVRKSSADLALQHQ